MSAPLRGLCSARKGALPGYALDCSPIGTALRFLDAVGTSAPVRCKSGKNRMGVLRSCAQCTWDPRDFTVADCLATNEVNAVQIAAGEAELSATSAAEELRLTGGQCYRLREMVGIGGTGNF